MKLFLAWMLMILIALPALGQEAQEISAAADNNRFKTSYQLFSSGKYRSTIEELDKVEAALLAKGNTNRQHFGLIHYWKGITYNRLQDYQKAIEHFGQALSFDYKPVDIHYEYGQALFAADKLAEARLQFRESVKRKYKRGVSIYYIAYTSKEMGENKKAVTFYKAVEKLGEEGKDVRQAAEVQIGDIYLEQVEKQRDSFTAVEKYVVPQYERALALDPDSALAPRIREKIYQLQRKYDLIMFQLRNGRPVLQPPHFFRASFETGMDSNVTFAPTETTIAASKQSSLYSRADFIGRYTFYHRDYISISPEFRFNYTYHFNRVPEIYRNDNYLLAPALRTAYEHELWEKPASVLFDYEYAEAKRDVYSKEDLVFSSRSHTLMIGERFNYFAGGESIARLRHRIFQSYDNASDSQTTSLVFEQVKGLNIHTLLFFLSYDVTRVNNDVYNTNSFTFRTDFIMARWGNWFTPSVGLGLTSIDPVNARAARGRELLINPNVRISRMFGKRWRGNLKYDYQKYNSKDTDNFAYKKSLYAFELEYLF